MALPQPLSFTHYYGTAFDYMNLLHFGKYKNYC